jgi:hypothetical protein
MEIDLTVFSVTVTLVRILIFFVLPLAYLVIKTRKDPRIYAKLEAFPGPKALPLFGNSLRLVGIGGSVGNPFFLQITIFCSFFTRHCGYFIEFLITLLTKKAQHLNHVKRRGMRNSKIFSGASNPGRNIMQPA